MPSPTIQILTVKPQGYAHSETFAELAETLRDAFLDLGTEACLTDNRFDPEAVNLILGWHLLDPAAERDLPPRCILYNLEQMDERNRPMLERLKRLAGRCEIWDYSRRNIDLLHQAGFPGSIQHVPIGVMPGLTRIQAALDQDIDVLFYGSVNNRRKHVLEALRAAGLRVHVAFGVYGAERDALIARAKVVLNLHYYDSSIFEMVRVSYLWANRKAVVAECHAATDLEPGLDEAARFVPYDRLIEACLDLVADAPARKALEVRGHEIMSARREADILRRVLAGEAEVPPPAGSGAPLCSLVVPVFNKVEYTRQCVEHLRKSTPDDLYELIFVDNASTDATAEFLASLQGRVKVLTNAENLGFVDACNQGAAEARGRYLVFLNNDTAPLSGWLEALVAQVEAEPTVGAAGSKLVYPDGRLQEAGGLIFRDGSGWNFGRFSDPLDPAFAVPAEVDYCSGAALLVRRELFERLGGFDRRYAPAYYEDTDLCFGLRSLGFKVMYCPASTVIHFEGITAGTDLSTGFKRFQAINQEKFVAKWADALAQQDSPPTETARPPATADRGRLRPVPSSSAGSPHVLIVDPFLPLHDRASGSLRLFRIIQILRAMGCEVTYIARYGMGQERYQLQLEAMGVEVLATDPQKLRQLGQDVQAPPIDLERILTRRPCHLAWLSFYDIAEQYLPDIRRISPGTPVVVDTVDVHFLREARLAQLTKDPAALAKAAQTRERELRIYAQADRVVTVTDADATVLRGAGLTVPTSVVPNIHLATEETPGWDARHGLVFVGNFNHTPNVDAALWLIQEILPKVRALVPDARLSIIGPNPPAAIQALSGPDVAILGWVPDTAPYLDAARVSVAPIRVGAGMKGKVGEALARGLPVVTTSVGAEGMGLEDGRQVLIADEAEAYAQQVARLLQDRNLWETLAQEGRAYITSTYGVEAAGKVLRDLVQLSPSSPQSAASVHPTPASGTISCRFCGRPSRLLASHHPGYRQHLTFAIHECPWCDVQFAVPATVPKGLYEDIYRNAAILPGYARYHRYASEISAQQDPLRWLGEQEDVYWFIREVLLTLAPGPQDPVFEIGSGLGYMTYALRRSGIRATGLDLSATAVEEATQKFGPYYRAAPAEVVAKEAAGQAAAVVLSEVLEHVLEPEVLLRNLMRLLRPGGLLLLTTPNKSAHPLGTLWDTENPPVHLWWFSETTLRIIAARLDLDIAFYDFSGFNALQWPGLRTSPPVAHRPPFLDAAGRALKTQADFPSPPRLEAPPIDVMTHFLHRKRDMVLQRSDSMGVILRRLA